MFCTVQLVWLYLLLSIDFTMKVVENPLQFITTLRFFTPDWSLGSY
jgi:hypothetical protein